MPPAFEVLLLNTTIPQIQAAQSGDTYVVPRDIAINATAIISANSATDALRITQIGAGNAILVEDSANPDSTPFVVTAAGDVGVGTTPPAYKLDVNGAINIAAGNFFRSGNNPLIASNGSTINYIYAGTSALAWRNQADTTELMRLDSSGNLGLGVPPSAWGASYKALQIGSASSFYNLSQNTIVGNNIFNDGTLRYLAAGYGTFYVQNSSGEHAWWNAPNWNGSGSNIASFTQAMTLDASGNLSVGTTSQTDKVTIDGGGVFLVWADDRKFWTGFSNTYRLGMRLDAVSRTTTLFATGDTGDGGTITFNTRAAAGSGATDYGTERARITSIGDFLVQANSSSVTSGVGHKIRPDAAAPFMGTVGSSTSGADTTYSLYSTGAAAYRFYVGYDGVISATNATITAISDQRLKENIRDLDIGLDAILALKPRKFDWKAGKGKDKKDDRGFIAQEFEQVFPDLIDNWKDPAPEGEEPYKAVRADLIPVLVKAIQEQQTMIDELKAEVAALKGA